jgi:hypothetical protein
MLPFLRRLHRFFGGSLDLRSRMIILVATLLLVPPTYVFRLWNMQMYANQYPAGLSLQIYSYKLDAGNKGNDLREINVLNHYIGMRALEKKDFVEFKWLPFLLGLFFILALRTVVLGQVTQLVDLVVMFTYFGLFSMWSFAYRLWVYGHSLDPMAAVKVPGFMPPLLGWKTLANFKVYSFPGPGSFFLALYPACLVVALLLAWRSAARREARSAAN